MTRINKFTLEGTKGKVFDCLTKIDHYHLGQKFQKRTKIVSGKLINWKKNELIGKCWTFKENELFSRLTKIDLFYLNPFCIIKPLN